MVDKRLQKLFSNAWRQASSKEKQLKKQSKKQMYQFMKMRKAVV